MNLARWAADRAVSADTHAVLVGGDGFAAVRVRHSRHLSAFTGASAAISLTGRPSTAGGPCCMDQPVDAVTQVLSVSFDADVGRASQLQHAVQDADSNRHLGRLTQVRLRAQRMTDHSFPAANIGFHQGTPVVP